MRPKRSAEQDAAERFARDTSGWTWTDPQGQEHTVRPHEMTVRHDDGLYRHLRFQSPDANTFWFDLITVPGVLIFRGDGDSFVFARQPDMFAFFRDSSWNGGPNVTYWEEKLTSAPSAAKCYRPELLRSQVWAEVRERGREYPGLAKAVYGHFFDAYWPLDHDEGAARTGLEEFVYGGRFAASCSCGSRIDRRDEHISLVRRTWESTHGRAGHDFAVTGHQEPFTFGDTSEWQLKDYHWWFLWACHAIVWGIAEYDRAQATAAVQDARAVTA